MTRNTTETFDLVPSIQARADLAPPIAQLAALPVRLGSAARLSQYAIVDTASQLSTMSSSVATDLGLDPGSGEGRGVSVVLSVHGRIGLVRIEKVALLLCREDFSPWLRFDEVPFAIVSGDSQMASRSPVVLGIESCLSNLRLTIDFSRGSLKVVAPSRFLTSEKARDLYHVPHRVVEGEKLIKFGSHDAAVTMIAAGLEEAFSKHLRQQKKGRRTLGQLSRMVDDLSLHAGTT